MKTIKVRITLELSSSDRESVYSYLKDLIEDESLDYDIVDAEHDKDVKHPLAYL